MKLFVVSAPGIMRQIEGLPSSKQQGGLLGGAQAVESKGESEAVVF